MISLKAPGNKSVSGAVPYSSDEPINSRNRKTEMYINQKRKFPSLSSHAQFLMPIKTGKYYYVIGKYSFNIK